MAQASAARHGVGAAVACDRGSVSSRWPCSPPRPPARTERPADKQAPAPAFPLKVAEGGRYLVDQNGAPFLIAGESPQALMVNLSEEDAELFFANRQSHGFNAVWINLLCRPGTGGRADGSTYDGLLPFEKPDDFTKPNEAYFARCDRMIRLAEKHGLLVILDPCETIDHLKPMLKNGPKACREFGRYLGKPLQGLRQHPLDARQRLPDVEGRGPRRGRAGGGPWDQGQRPASSAHGRAELRGERLARRRPLGRRSST